MKKKNIPHSEILRKTDYILGVVIREGKDLTIHYKCPSTELAAKLMIVNWTISKKVAAQK